MRQSRLFQKTTKNISRLEISRNAQLLTKAGYINQLMAGVYSYMPLGLRVLNKIENIIRQEMNAINGQELLMPALHPKDIWQTTGRWDNVDVLFKLKGAGDRDLALGPTHEEVVTPLGASLISSYKDLPVAAYQIQTKFRNEARAKSGLLRGREFRMKDMYSFHADQNDLDAYYDVVTKAYTRIFERCGLGDKTKITFASGGIFSKYSHEFQTVTEYGEDIIYLVPGTTLAINKEIINDRDALKEIVPNYTAGMEENFEQCKAIEVGNIFKLGTKFSDVCGVRFTTSDGTIQIPVMGCYGIGPSRIMGTVAECLSDEKGLIWPVEVAPYKIHLIRLAHKEDHIQRCDEIYEMLIRTNIDVLYDDRPNIAAGTKFADSDLLGIPQKLIISEKTLNENNLEWRGRTEQQSVAISIDNLAAHIANMQS